MLKAQPLTLLKIDQQLQVLQSLSQGIALVLISKVWSWKQVCVRACVITTLQLA